MSLPMKRTRLVLFRGQVAVWGSAGSGFGFWQPGGCVWLRLQQMDEIHPISRKNHPLPCGLPTLKEKVRQFS